MKYIKLKDHKYRNCIYPLILIIIYAVFITLTWGKWGHIIYDCFREATIPQAILDGKILYRDILNLYPPLAYQFNAVLYFIFGNSLNTLYWAGIINSFLILSVIYFIVRKYSNHLVAFIITLSIMEIFVFKIPFTTGSWIFPYSYSFIYAFSSCLLGFLFYILYKKKSDKTGFLLTSLFFAGLSVAFKLDFIIFGFLPLYDTVKTAIKDKSFKIIFKGVAFYILPIFISLSLFILNAHFAGSNGFKILFDEINFLNDFSKAPSVVLYNREVMPQSFNIDIFKTVFLSFFRFLLISSVLFCYTYFCIFLLSKIKNITLKTLLGTGLFTLGYSIIIICTALYQFSLFGIYKDLAFLSYFVTISALVIFILKFKNKSENKFNKEEKFYLLTTIFAILISFRCYAIVYITCIGNFILIIWWLLFVYFFIKMLPEYFPTIFKNKILKKALCLFFMVIGLYFTFTFALNSLRTSYKIETSKGSICVSKEYYYPIKEAIGFIESNIPKEGRLLVLEEGLIFNYLTDTKTDLKHYALIPHMVDALGEDNIIKELRKNPPEYIFITNDKYMTEAGGYFGIDYAKKIYAYIQENYKYIKIIENPDRDSDFELNLKIKIFKLK